MIGETLNYEGEVAILSAASTMTNQNTWIEFMMEEWKDPKYANMPHVATVYGDDQDDKSYREMQALVKAHPNLKGVISPTTIGIRSGAKAIMDEGLVGQVYITGLGLPSEMIYRHPFPGPGLGVRILGEVKKEYADLLRLADHIYIEELHRHGLYDEVSQAFTVFLPVKSVGVVGDARRYEYVVTLRTVKTVDFMTAHFAHLPFEFLETVSRRIINEVPGISRVAYDISSKPPATIEWE